MFKELSPLVIYQIFKSKYLAKYEFSTGETLTCDAKCISLFSLLGNILFHCYYTAVACENSHGVSMAYKFSMAYFSRTEFLFSYSPIIFKNVLGLVLQIFLCINHLNVTQRLIG